MIFYESVVTQTRNGMRQIIPKTHGSEAQARTAFNAAKRSIKKSGLAGDCCAYFKCTATTDLSKEGWLRLFLGDHQGGHTCDEDDVMYVRDLITKRKCIREYCHEAG